MPADNLGIKERAALLALMAAAREVTNPELEELAGFRLTGAPLRKLRDRGLVASRTRADLRYRPLSHSLTEAGWAWCAAELTAGPPASAGSAGGALYAVLAGLHGHLARSGADLRDLFRPAGAPPAKVEPQPPAAPVAAQAPVPADLAERIRIAYRKLTKEPRDLVSLTQLRPLLGPASRADVDATLRQLSRSRQANLLPQANQKILSQADRAAAVRIGNEDCHFISIEDS